MDKTNHALSITGHRGGPRATTYHNPLLQRGHKVKAKQGRHVTGVYATNAAGEAIPPMYIFDSSAKSERIFRIRCSWVENLPKVSGRFGCPETQHDVASYYAVRSRGSMDDSLFNNYVEEVIIPLYPNISKRARFDQNGKLLCGPVILKVDSGPGRLVANAESIRKREDFMERGLLIMLGLPNATSVNQEMDALFQGFKTASDARGEILLTERMKKQGELRTVRREFNAEESEEDGNEATGCTRFVTMGFEDLATVVNGTEDDTVGVKQGILLSFSTVEQCWNKNRKFKSGSKSTKRADGFGRGKNCGSGKLKVRTACQEFGKCTTGFAKVFADTLEYEQQRLD